MTLLLSTAFTWDTNMITVIKTTRVLRELTCFTLGFISQSKMRKQFHMLQGVTINYVQRATQAQLY